MYLKRDGDGYRAIVQYKGQRRSVSGATRAETQRRAGEMLAAMGGTPDASDMTVGEMVADYLAHLAENASPKYFDEAERAFDRIPEPFANRLARKTNGVHLAALYRELGNKYPTSAVRRIHTVLIAAFNRAVDLGALAVVPGVGKPEQPAPTVQPPTDEQARAILAQVDGLDLLALRLSAVTGCRRGEVVAIQWVDLDLDRAQLHVRRSLVMAKKVLHERDTKTGRKGHRKIALDLPTVAMLKRWKAEQAAAALAVGMTPKWVISSDNGHTPWRPDHLSDVFIDARKIAERVGVADGVEVPRWPVRLHDLRHYVATNMLADGEPVAAVAQRLGHASVATTAEIYAHWIDGTDAEASKRLAARLG